jgi:hypothetical protein
MDRKCGCGAGGEAGNGLDQRGGEARMVVTHQGEVSCIIVGTWEGNKKKLL